MGQNLLMVSPSQLTGPARCTQSVFSEVMFAPTCVWVCVSKLPADLSGRCG